MDRRGGNPFRGEPLSGQYDWGYREYDAKCWADYYGIPFREPVDVQGRSRQAGAGLPGGRPAGRAGAVLPAAAAADLRRRRGDRRRRRIAGCRSGSAWMRQAFRRDLAASPRRARGTTACWTRPRPRRVRRPDVLPRRADVLGQRPPGVARGGVARNSIVQRHQGRRHGYHRRGRSRAWRPQDPRQRGGAGAVHRRHERNRNAELDARRIARTPLGRLGAVDDIARVICFLAGDEGGFLTGQTLAADGGFTTANL